MKLHHGVGVLLIPCFTIIVFYTTWLQSTSLCLWKIQGDYVQQAQTNRCSAGWTAFNSKIVQQLDFSSIPKPKKLIKILRYQMRDVDLELPLGVHCKEYCIVSLNRSMFAEADLVIFIDVFADDLKRAFPKQRWAFMSIESPYHRHGFTSEHYYKHKLDWFANVYPNSIVSYTYGVYKPFANRSTHCADAPMNMGDRKEHRRASNALKWLPKHHAQRTKKVAWVVSNNFANPSLRNPYAEELAKHISVDFYGLVYGNHTPFCRGGVATECFGNLSLHYKFYLAFENSRCRYYITEKLFTNCLKPGMLPVVLGAPSEDYKLIAPPNSFIHVDDFNSPKELADYLHYLDRNDTAYAAYFAWREWGEILSPTDLPCRFCWLMHQLQLRSEKNESTKDLFSKKSLYYYFSRERFCIGGDRWIEPK